MTTASTRTSPGQNPGGFCASPGLHGSSLSFPLLCLSLSNLPLWLTTKTVYFCNG